MSKFRKATSPAFNIGEVWVGNSGNKVTVVSIRKILGATGEHESDYAVLYEWLEGSELRSHEKDCWNFQTRYTHLSDIGK